MRFVIAMKTFPIRPALKVQPLLTSRWVRLFSLCFVVSFSGSLAAPPAMGQSSAIASPAIPRTPDGKPDFSGFWQAISSANGDIEDHSAQKGEPGGQGIVEGDVIPYQPWALQKKKANYAARDTEDPQTKAYLQGVPRITYTPFPFQIIQTPKQTIILYEYV